MWDPYAEFETATLPNGLTVHATHWAERPWEAVGFVVHSGAEQDPVGLEGLIHFIEHLVSKNVDIPQKDIRAFFGECGGGANFGVTSSKSTDYHFFVPVDKKVLSKAFSLFGQMLLQNKLERFIERERQVIVSEFHRYFPLKFNFDLAMRGHRALYKGYWLERFASPLGNPESVGRISQADLQAHYDTHYTPANISVVGVGGMSLAEMVNLLSESPFSMDKRGLRTPLPNCLTDVNPPLEIRHVFEISKHMSMSTSVEVGSYRSVAVIPGNVNTVLRILKNMLDEILDDEVRQFRAWAYDIGCGLYNYRYFHEFAINCGALNLNAIDTIDDVVETCIASLTDREDLFEKVKRCSISKNLMIDPSGKGIRDNCLNDLANYHRIVSLAEETREMEALQMSDIRQILPWLRPERRWTLIRRP